MVLHRLPVPGCGIDFQLGSIRLWVTPEAWKILPSKGFAQGLVQTVFHSNGLQRNDLPWRKHHFKATSLLKLSIFFHLKLKQHRIFKSVWRNAMGPGHNNINYFWTTAMAGIGKQRQQGGCREAEALVPVSSWREGRQPPALCPHLFRGCFACPAGKLPQGPAPSLPSPRWDE